jgi:hypothetical protein
MESRPFELPLHPTRVGLLLGVLLVLLPLVLWMALVTALAAPAEGGALAAIASRAPAHETKAP